MLVNFLVRTIQCTETLIFICFALAHANIKTDTLTALTALTAQNGPKLKFNVGNLDQETSVYCFVDSRSKAIPLWYIDI